MEMKPHQIAVVSLIIILGVAIGFASWTALVYWIWKLFC
jgi:hypothetical protein